MRVPDEHMKLARIALMFSPELDEAFGINIAKMRVTLPPELTERIDTLVTRTMRRARAVYDAKPDEPRNSPSRGRRGGTAIQNGGQEAPGASGNAAPIAGTATASTSTIVTGARRRALEDAAEAAGERRALKKIVKKLERHSPEVAKDLGF
jgi:hypothetical protein